MHTHTCMHTCTHSYTDTNLYTPVQTLTYSIIEKDLEQQRATQCKKLEKQCEQHIIDQTTKYERRMNVC